MRDQNCTEDSKFVTRPESRYSSQIKMTDEVLQTLFCEVEDMLNNRPLTSVTADLEDFDALTPNHLLKLNSNTNFPPGIFSNEDFYSKRRWKQIQYLADVFWTRWRRQYLPQLQERQKWTLPQRSLQVGDLVLVVDQHLPRNMWSKGRVMAVKKDPKGFVRSASVKLPFFNNGKKLFYKSTIIERSITKLIFLLTNED